MGNIYIYICYVINVQVPLQFWHMSRKTPLALNTVNFVIQLNFRSAYQVNIVTA